MTTRPTTLPSWATGAGRRVEPDTGEKASGFVEATRTAARKANWALGLVADWIAYLGEDGVASTLVVPASDFVLGTASDGSAQWRVASSGAFGAAPSFRPLVDHAYAWGFIRLPRGANLSKIEIMVSADSSRVTSTDRWNVRAFKRAWDWTPSISSPTLTEIGSIQDDGTGTGLRLITFSGLDEDVSGADDDYYVWVQAPNSVGSSDHLLALRATFTAPRLA